MVIPYPAQNGSVIPQPSRHHSKIRRRAPQSRPLGQQIPQQLAQSQYQMLFPQTPTSVPQSLCPSLSSFTISLFHSFTSSLPSLLHSFTASPTHRQIEQSSAFDDVYSPS